jgi:hypothetical protein
MKQLAIPSKTNETKSSFHPNCSLGGKKNKTVKAKPTSSGPNNKPLFLCNPFVSNMLVKGSFKTIVELPKYVDANEWLAFNSKKFTENQKQPFPVNHTQNHFVVSI